MRWGLPEERGQNNTAILFVLFCVDVILILIITVYPLWWHMIADNIPMKTTEGNAGHQGEKSILNMGTLWKGLFINPFKIIFAA